MNLHPSAEAISLIYQLELDSIKNVQLPDIITIVVRNLLDCDIQTDHIKELLFRNESLYIDDALTQYNDYPHIFLLEFFRNYYKSYEVWFEETVKPIGPLLFSVSNSKGFVDEVIRFALNSKENLSNKTCRLFYPWNNRDFLQIPNSVTAKIVEVLWNQKSKFRDQSGEDYIEDEIDHHDIEQAIQQIVGKIDSIEFNSELIDQIDPACRENIRKLFAEHTKSINYISTLFKEASTRSDNFKNFYTGNDAEDVELLLSKIRDFKSYNAMRLPWNEFVEHLMGHVPVVHVEIHKWIKRTCQLFLGRDDLVSEFLTIGNTYFMSSNTYSISPITYNFNNYGRNISEKIGLLYAIGTPFAKQELLTFICTSYNPKLKNDTRDIIINRFFVWFLANYTEISGKEIESTILVDGFLELTELSKNPTIAQYFEKMMGFPLFLTDDPEKNIEYLLKYELQKQNCSPLRFDFDWVSMKSIERSLPEKIMQKVSCLPNRLCKLLNIEEYPSEVTPTNNATDQEKNLSEWTKQVYSIVHKNDSLVPLIIAETDGDTSGKLALLITIGTKKSYTAAWDLLSRNNFRYDREITILIERWGNSFPTKLLRKAIERKVDGIVPAAFASFNPVVLRYLNSIADQVDFSEYDEKQLMYLFTRFWDRNENGEKAFRADAIGVDISRLWISVVSRFWTPGMSKHFDFTHAIVAGDRDFLMSIEPNEFEIEQFLLLHPTLLKNYGELLSNDIEFSVKAENLVLKIFVMMLQRRYPLRDFYRYPMSFYSTAYRHLKKAADEDTNFRDGFPSFDPLFGRIATFLWIHGEIQEHPSVDSFEIESEFIKYALVVKPFSFPMYSKTNRLFAEYVLKKKVEDYEDGVYYHSDEEEWQAFWRKNIETSAQELVHPVEKKTLGIPLTKEYESHVVHSLIDSISAPVDSTYFADYSELVEDQRSRSIRALLKKGDITIEEAEKLHSHTSKSSSFGLSKSEIVACFDERKDSSSKMNDILANIEASFQPELLRESISWILNHRESILWENAPWTGMKLFSESFSDRTTIWARQIAALLKNHSWDEKTELRLCFALGHLREILGGEAVSALQASAERQNNQRNREIILNQIALFDSENIRSGQSRSKTKRVSDCRKEIIKAQNNLAKV